MLKQHNSLISIHAFKRLIKIFKILKSFEWDISNLFKDYHATEKIAHTIFFT